MSSNMLPKQTYSYFSLKSETLEITSSRCLIFPSSVIGILIFKYQVISYDTFTKYFSLHILIDKKYIGFIVNYILQNWHYSNLDWIGPKSGINLINYLLMLVFQ